MTLPALSDIMTFYRTFPSRIIFFENVYVVGPSGFHDVTSDQLEGPDTKTQPRQLSPLRGLTKAKIRPKGIS